MKTDDKIFRAIIIFILGVIAGLVISSSRDLKDTMYKLAEESYHYESYEETTTTVDTATSELC